MQALQNWSETMRKEDELEKEVLKKLTDPLQVQFLPFLLLREQRLGN